MATYTTGSSLLSDVMPQIKQYIATTGRNPSAKYIQGLLQAKIKEDQAFAAQARALDIQQQNVQSQVEARKAATDLANKQQKAAAIQGLLTAPATLYGTAKGTEALYGYGKELLGFGGETAAATAPITAADITAAGQFAAPGALTAPVAEAPVIAAPTTFGTAADVGAQTAAGVAGAGTATGAQAALTAAEAGAEGFVPGVTGATTAAAGEGAAATGGGLLGAAAPLLAPAAAGLLGSALLAEPLDKILPGGGKTGKVVGGVAGGAAAGAAIGSVVPGVGTVVGGVVGGIVGGISSAVGSVVCSELLRQGKISSLDRKYAVLFRLKFISDELYAAYLEWAAPYVMIMQRGGTGNEELHPRMMAFVQYMIKKAKDEEPTAYEFRTYKEIYDECLEIVQKQKLEKVA